MTQIVHARNRRNTWISIGNDRAQKQWRGESETDSIVIRDMRPGKYLLQMTRERILINRLDLFGNQVPWTKDRHLGVIPIGDGSLYLGSSIDGIDFRKIAGNRCGKVSVMVGYDHRGRAIAASLVYCDD